jgi:hypothetical protein
MNRFKLPCLADEIATCMDCGSEGHHEQMRMVDDGVLLGYRCEDCYEAAQEEK